MKRAATSPSRRFRMPELWGTCENPETPGLPVVLISPVGLSQLQAVRSRIFLCNPGMRPSEDVSSRLYGEI